MFETWVLGCRIDNLQPDRHIIRKSDDRRPAFVGLLATTTQWLPVPTAPLACPVRNVAF